MLNIAVISDSDKFLHWVKPILTKEGYEVSLYPLSGKKLIEQIIDAGTEIAIIDFFTNIKESTRALNEFKKESGSFKCHLIAVIQDDIAEDFDFTSGCDDFIFDDSIQRELALKIGLFQWKAHKVDSKDKIVAHEFVIDNANYEVSFKGEKVALTFKEFELLKFLITHRGRVYSRDALLNQVWGYNYYGGTRTVDVHIRRLRSKVGIEMDKYLKTVRNVGYKFEK
jgi:DNA-binding response OmpR family regulator